MNKLMRVFTVLAGAVAATLGSSTFAMAAEGGAGGQAGLIAIGAGIAIAGAAFGAALGQVALVFSLPQRSQRKRVISSPRCTAKGSLFTGRHLWCPFRQSVWFGFCGFSKRRISAMKRQLAVLARLTACCQDSNLRRRGPVPIRDGKR